MLRHIDLHTVHQARMLQTGNGFGHASLIAIPQGDAAARSQYTLGNGIAQACCAARDDRMAAFHVVLVHKFFEEVVRLK